MFIDKTFVINLDRSPDRLEEIRSHLDARGVPFTRFSAVDGKQLPYDHIVKHTTVACRTLLCTKAIVGCALSHYKLWRHVADGSHQWVLILEDDAKLDVDFKDKMEVLHQSLQRHPEVDMVYLYAQGDYGQDDMAASKLFSQFMSAMGTKTNLPSSDVLVPPFPLCTAAYILSKRGAEKLARMVERDGIRYHIDFQISMFSDVNAIYFKAAETGYEHDSTIGTRIYPFIIPNVLHFAGMHRTAWESTLPAGGFMLDYTISSTMLLYIVVLTMLLFCESPWLPIFAVFIFLEFLWYKFFI